MMYCIARDTQQQAGRTDQQARNSSAVNYTATMKARSSASAAMGRRMTLIVATDAACWLPIIALGVASLCGVEVPAKVGKKIARRCLSSASDNNANQCFA